VSLKMSENLRREIRVDARIAVAIVRGRTAVPLETADVSFKGLFVQTTEAAPVRSLLRLRVTLPTREIEAHAMVVHVVALGDAPEGSRGPGLGLQFWGLAGPDRNAWDSFVGDLLRERKKSVAPPAPVDALAENDPSFGDRATPSGIRIASSSMMPVSSVYVVPTAAEHEPAIKKPG
jgi:hypothetical protein